MNWPMAEAGALAVLVLAVANESYVRWARVTWRGALGMVLAAVAVTGGVLWMYQARNERLPLESALRQAQYFWWSEEVRWLSLAALLAAGLLGIGWVGKLYAAWVLGRLRGDEGRRDWRCVRAWLGPVNLVLLGLFAVSAWAGWGWPMGWTAVAGMIALVAYPVVHVGVQEEGGEREDRGGGGGVAEERRRVLAMVELGKISGADGAELIGALGAGQDERRMGRQGSTGLGGSVAGRMRGVGAVLVGAGFFLPWFRVPMELQWTRDMAMGMGVLGANDPWDAKVVMDVHGVSLAHGLGWAVLAMGVLPALVELLWKGEGRRGLSAGLLAVGTVVLVYVASLGVRFSAEGLWMVAAGYGAMWGGMVRAVGMGEVRRRMVEM